MLNQTEIISILQDAIYTTIIAAMPMLAVALVIGVVVSIFQATTQINEQTLSFVPKIIGILLAVLIFGGWIITKTTDFTYRLFESIITYVA
ncbi:MAG: flagellar biosynthesis protein FliQ [Oscillospiraceae bacterium]|jgi:flagellar biosynthetic protein FliQ